LSAELVPGHCFFSGNMKSLWTFFALLSLPFFIPHSFLYGLLRCAAAGAARLGVKY